jgi:hypothetical protein
MSEQIMNNGKRRVKPLRLFSTPRPPRLHQAHQEGGANSNLACAPACGGAKAFGDRNTRPRNLFESLQVAPHPVLGYRPSVGAYVVNEDINVPTSQALANIHLGAGGGTQFYVNNFSNKLSP